MSVDKYGAIDEAKDERINEAIEEFFGTKSGDELEKLILEISQEVFSMAEVSEGYTFQYAHYRKLVLKYIINSAVHLLYTAR